MKSTTLPDRTHDKPLEIKVIFLPQFDEVPYQLQLAQELGRLGVDVEGVRWPGPEASMTQWLPPSIARTDILHLHWLHPLVLGRGRKESLRKALIYAWQLWSLRRQGVRIAWTVHNIQNHENQLVRLERWCSKLTARLAHTVITHGELARREVIREFRVADESKVVVVPQGNYIDSYPNSIKREQARRTLQLNDDETVFLFLGMIRPYKGVLELIEAFKRLETPRARLLIAGESWDEELVSEIQRRTQGQKQISFRRGFVPDEEIQLFMNACDVTVYPFRAVLTSATVMLSLSFGRACIAPRLGCISEILDERGGFTYDPADENGLLTALREAVRRRDELPRMGDHNRRQAEEWNWERVATMTAQIYRDCLKR